jgi:hypothetical protein
MERKMTSSTTDTQSAASSAFTGTSLIARCTHAHTQECTRAYTRTHVQHEEREKRAMLRRERAAAHLHLEQRTAARGRELRHAPRLNGRQHVHPRAQPRVRCLSGAAPHDREACECGNEQALCGSKQAQAQAHSAASH